MRRPDAPLDAAAREALADWVIVSALYGGLTIGERLLLQAAVEAAEAAILRELRQPTTPFLADLFEIEIEEGGDDD